MKSRIAKVAICLIVPFIGLMLMSCADNWGTWIVGLILLICAPAWVLGCLEIRLRDRQIQETVKRIAHHVPHAPFSPRDHKTLSADRAV